MVYKLEIKDEAEQDIIDGFYFYSQKGNNLGERFVNEAEDIFNYIEKYPKHFQIVYKEFRQRILKSFPYVVIYKITDDKVIVFSVFPAKSDPSKRPV